MIVIRLPAAGSAAPPWRSYRIAGERLVSEVAFDALQPFAVAGDGGPWPAASDAGLAATPGRPLFDGEAWLGGEHRRVRCWVHDATYRIEVSEVGTFLVAADSAVTALELAPGAQSGPVVETVLGPALILALAQRGTFSLHASALARSGAAVALVGLSGSGKSTLASYLDGRSGWRRVADDVLPVVARAGGAEIRPAFPQLKLGAGEQVRAPQDLRLPLSAVYLVERAAEGGATALSEPLARAAASLVVARHTVAARLFAPELLAEHLVFSTEIGERIPLRRLTYPHHRRAPAEVSELLAAAPEPGSACTSTKSELEEDEF